MIKPTKREEMYEKIEKHGATLNKIFNTGLENIALCKKLRRLENTAHYYAERWCNGDMNEAEFTEKSADIRKLVIKTLKLKPEGNLCPDDMTPIFYNSDPRGYALKISDSYIKENNIEIYRDWGGYGILAPDFS